jgi:AraC family transcriptional regulator, regulatory protein of adaptative response / DNA-3-methyladenine glycosylase II
VAIPRHVQVRKRRDGAGQTGYTKEVLLDSDACFRAIRARDARFDGMFFVGVTSTKIYCRPICPVRTPAAQRCRFFALAAEAERAGFRACLRCRPERAPGKAAVDAVPHLVRAATARIDAGYLDDHSVEELADRLGVTARHLRRAMEAELGVSPVELAQSRRLALARQLLVDGTLPVTEVAHAAGFASLRRFHALFRAQYGRAPGALRRATRASAAAAEAGAVELRLDYRPPLAWDALLGFFASRAIPGVEEVDGAAGIYRRTVGIGTAVGWLEVRRDRDHDAIRVRVARTLTSRLPWIAARVRAMFDLDARPDVVDGQLAADPALRAGLRARPGVRLPGAFDGAEVAVRAVLGQQVSVAAATTLARRLVDRFGRPVTGAPGALDRLFPAMPVLAAADVDAVRAIGLPGARAQAIIGLAAALADGAGGPTGSGAGPHGVDLSPGADPDRAVAALAELPGLGPWTASYVAMRALSWPDAFLEGDLVVRKALGVTTPKAALARAERWRPWRAYAVMHLWMGGLS